MVRPQVILQADLPPCHVLVAHVAECLALGRLALLVHLELAALQVEQLANVSQLFLLVAPVLLGFLLLCRLPEDPPLCLPVSPHVGQLVCRQERLVVLLVQRIAPEDVALLLLPPSSSTM